MSTHYLPGHLRASPIKDLAKVYPCSAGRQASVQAESLDMLPANLRAGSYDVPVNCHPAKPVAVRSQ